MKWQWNIVMQTTGMLVAAVILVAHAAGGIPFELQKAIEEKNRALQEITNQLQATHENLAETEGKSQSLKQELASLNYRINQANLGIKSSEISIEKLDLEITSLQYEIQEAESTSDHIKSAMTVALRTLRQKDGENLLVVILRNKTLSESFGEIEQISNINKLLADESIKLKAIRETLTKKLDERSQKKSAVEQEHRTLKARKEIAEDQKTERATLLVQTKNQEKIYQQTITELEKKQLAISDEIEAIEKELRSKIDPSLLPQKRPGVLFVPTQGRLSQGFGETAFAKNGYRGHFHNGIDIAASIGTPIYAAEKGTIKKIENQDLFCRKGAYGKFIVIEHENNLVTLYGHMSLFNTLLLEGQQVQRGDIIGYVGKTGYATGPHLHLTVYSKPTFYIGPSRTCGPMPYGGVLNPLDYLQI